MVGQGPRVGAAHVKVTASGDGIDDDIVDAVADSGPGVEKEGDKLGQRVGKGINKGLSKSLSKKLRAQLDGIATQAAKSLEKQMQASGDRAADQFAKQLKKTLDKTLGKALDRSLTRVGDNIADRLELSLAQMLDMMEASFQKTLSRGSGGTPRSQPERDHGKQPGYPVEHMLEQAAKLNRAFDVRRHKMIDAAYKADRKHDTDRIKLLEFAHKLNTAFDLKRVKMLEAAYKQNDAFDRRRIKMLETAHRMNEQFDKNRAVMLDRAYKQNEDHDRKRLLMLEQAHRMNEAFDRKRTVMLDRAYKMHAKFMAGGLTGDGRSRGSGPSNDKSLGDRIGRMLGAGGRSDALHYLGRSLGNIVDLVNKGRTGFVGFFSLMKTGWKSAADGASIFTKAMSMFGKSGVGGAMLGGLSKGFAAIVRSGPAAALAIVVVVGAFSALASVLGALLGIITAFASGVASALVGALAAGTGAILAMVAAGGLLTSAFMSMTDAQKKLMAEAFSPLRSQMVGIGQLMMEQMVGVFPKWSANLQQALNLVVPVARNMGDAFARAGSILTAAFSAREQRAGEPPARDRDPPQLRARGLPQRRDGSVRRDPAVRQPLRLVSVRRGVPLRQVGHVAAGAERDRGLRDPRGRRPTVAVGHGHRVRRLRPLRAVLPRSAERGPVDLRRVEGCLRALPPGGGERRS